MDSRVAEDRAARHLRRARRLLRPRAAAARRSRPTTSRRSRCRRRPPSPAASTVTASGCPRSWSPPTPSATTSPTSVYDHTSVLAFIERKWNLPALTYRDANAHPITDFFDFTEPGIRRAAEAGRGAGPGSRTRAVPRRRPQPTVALGATVLALVAAGVAPSAQGRTDRRPAADPVPVLAIELPRADDGLPGATRAGCWPPSRFSWGRCGARLTGRRCRGTRVRLADRAPQLAGDRAGRRRLRRVRRARRPIDGTAAGLLGGTADPDVHRLSQGRARPVAPRRSRRRDAPTPRELARLVGTLRRGAGHRAADRRRSG